jgi:hypothetical protein
VCSYWELTAFYLRKPTPRLRSESRGPTLKVCFTTISTKLGTERRLESYEKEGAMQDITRRSAVALSLAAAASVAAEAQAQGTGGGAPQPKETQRGPGVIQREYGQERSLIPGFQTVSMRDLIVEPGAVFKSGMPMPNAMVCHITEGELLVHQDGRTITAPTFYVWTCNKGTDEWVENKGTVRSVMRITDLKA